MSDFDPEFVRTCESVEELERLKKQELQDVVGVLGLLLARTLTSAQMKAEVARVLLEKKLVKRIESAEAELPEEPSEESDEKGDGKSTISLATGRTPVEVQLRLAELNFEIKRLELVDRERVREFQFRKAEMEAAAERDFQIRKL